MANSEVDENVIAREMEATMKSKLRSICMVLIFLIPYVQTFGLETFWSRRNPLPTGGALYGAFFHDSLRAWFVGSMGALVSTTDGGLTWKEDLLRPRGELQRIHFTNEQHGVIVGGDEGAQNGAIFVTTDGGETWVDRYNDPTRYALFDVAFRGSDTGWASGFLGILKTTDGGVTWVQNQSPGLSWNTSVFFINDSLGWATNPTGGIFKSTNTGTTWTRVAALGFRWLRRIRFATPLIGWAVGGGLYENKATIFKTTDGGTTWALQDSLLGRTYTDVYVIDTLNAWVVGTGGIVHYTTDGGGIWFTDITNNGDNYHQITFVDGKPWIVGGSYSYATILTYGSPGFRWKMKSSKITLESLRSVAFEDDLRGWIGGSNGILLRTTDRGDHWSALSLFAIDLLALSAPAPDHLYIGGSSGNFLKTTNAGTSWTITQIPGMYAVSKMQFVDPLTGWAMDEYYPFVKTTDGGQSWMNMPVGGTVFFFVDQNNGWLAQPIVTNGPGPQWTFLHRTTDGGTTWQDSLFNVGIIDITFTSLEEGWFLADYASVYRTTDAGVSWNHVHTFNESVHKIEFTTGLDGWASGDEAMYSTTDGGTTFNVSRYSNFYSVRELYFQSPSFGFAVGENGTILRYFDPTTDVRYDDQTSIDIPSTFVLKQNYPNPFNPTTTISFSLPSQAFVSLKVFNALGREVSTLLAEELPPGTYEQPWNARGLASGVYYYRLQAGSFMETKKLVLLK